MLDNDQLEKLRKKLKKHISPKRYRHSIGVQYTAVMLAMRYGEDLQKAALAGLLHDCAKNLDDDEMLKECKHHDITCSDIEREQPYLLHAKLGARYAGKKYHVDDPEILSAIRYHTTGRADMSPLEKIIFVADFIEPHRKMLPTLPVIRQTAFQDIDEAVYKILESTISYLDAPPTGQKKPKKIEPHTLEAYQYYKELHVHKKGRNPKIS